MPDDSNNPKSQRPVGKGVPPSAGLCATCIHVRKVESAKGSIFVLCTLSGTDHRFPKYPALPVLSCRGYCGTE